MTNSDPRCSADSKSAGRALALLSLLLLTACDPNAGTQSIKDSPNGYGDARFMGTVDGCRLWSVNNGQFYFANCRGGVTSTGWSRMVGKVTQHYSASSDEQPQ